MAYCTREDVIGELHPTLRLTMSRHYDSAHASDPTQNDFEHFLDYHIKKADSFVDASLARAYHVPIQRATYVVVSAACKIAAFFAAAAFGEKEEILKDKYETALSMLDNAVKANSPGLVDEGATIVPPTVAAAGYGSAAAIFTEEELARW